MNVLYTTFFFYPTTNLINTPFFTVQMYRCYSLTKKYDVTLMWIKLVRSHTLNFVDTSPSCDH